MTKLLMKPQMSTIHMTLSPISTLDEIYSPNVFIHGIPWQIEVSRNKEENSLAVYLTCDKKGDSSNWTVSACVTIELLSFDDDENPIKQYIEPYVFRPSCLSYGCPSFIEWDELMNDENQYVRDDTIELKIGIVAEDPNYVDRSILKFEHIDKSCDCGSLARFRFTIMNVENLMAVRSPPFILRGLPWDLTVYKYQSSSLGIMLDAKQSSTEVSCNVEMSVKLLSSKEDVMPIEKSDEKSLEMFENLKINIVPWNEMLKPENGYVNSNSITLEVKITTDKPVGKVPNVDRNYEAKRGRFECSICLDGLDSQDMSITPCGHSFCTACIIKSVRNRSACPLCQEAVQDQDLRRLYLSAAK